MRTPFKNKRLGKDNWVVPPSAKQMSVLGVLSFGSVAPLYQELPPSLAIYIFVLFGLHFISQHYPRVRPGRIAMLGLTLLGVWMVFRQFHTLFGYQAGISWLATMLALKILETRSERDFYIATILGCFFLVSQFLLNQSMYLAVYALLIALGLLCVLVSHNQSASVSLLNSLRLSGTIFVQSIPLVVVMFILFPRLHTPLWGLDLGTNRGITGLGESLNPGSVTQLVKSREIAFRAEFFGPVPEQSELYWRGPVFWNTDGMGWFGEGPDKRTEFRLETTEWDDERVYDYRLILEPHGKNWILPLDLPVHAPRNTSLTADFQLLTIEPVSTRQQFLLKSSTTIRSNKLSEPERETALYIPGIISDRIQALVAGWKNNSATKEDIVHTALHFFNQQDFVYTLTPPHLSGDRIDLFLFETRAGFCEHYASAFSILMRLAGLPSRVVTGYLGGEYNALGDYFFVRQSNAHAWSEVWLPDKGWVRVDPTAAIAPQRIFQEISFSDDQVGNPISFRIIEEGWFSGLGLLRRIRHALDALHTQWHIWVLGYDSDRQMRLLAMVGLKGLDKYQSIVLMLLLLVLLLAPLGFILLHSQRTRKEPLARLYDQFCHRLKALGIDRKKHEGPQDFATRATIHRPDLDADIKSICNLYAKLKFSNNYSLEDLEQLRSDVKRFRPKKR